MQVDKYYPSLKEFRKKAKKGNLVPVYKDIFADTQTPVSAFRKIDKGRFSFLLESVEGSEKIARNSFLGCDSSLVFKSRGNVVRIIRDGKKEEYQNVDNPLMKLKEMLSAYKPVVDEDLPRFIGGAVGFFGYDMIRFIEDIPDTNPEDIVLPDSVFMFTDTILVFDHLKNIIKVISNAHIEGNVDKAYHDAVKKIDGIIKKLGSRKAAKVKKPAKRKIFKVESNFKKKDFENAVRKAKKYIKAGDIVQTVLSQRFGRLITADPLNIYRALRSINPSPFMYYLKDDDLFMVGSSPEIMVRLDEGKVVVRPIAGTRRRGRNEEEDKKLAKELLMDPKENAEHIMLVDLGRNDVGRVCRYGTVRVNEFMTIEKYSHVMHIVSNVEGRIKKGKDAFDVLAACFPAGTVTGAPKVRAMEIIDELENVKRGPYAGAVGYISFSGNLDTCITIRTVVIKDGKAYVQAGAGIVADSNPAREYEETCNKAKGMLKAIELAESGEIV